MQSSRNNSTINAPNRMLTLRSGIIQPDIKERTRHDKDLKKHTARVASSADENATNPDPLLCP
jgi:hypothetical protein